MSQEQNQQKAKSGAEVVKQIEDRVFSGKLGAIRKKIEELVPERDKALDVYEGVQAKLDAAIQEYDELLASKQ